MFDADYVDIKLSRVREFTGIGSSDTLRLNEPNASFLDRTFKTEEDLEKAMKQEIKKNLLVVRDDGTAHEPGSECKIYEIISMKEGLEIRKKFKKLMGDEEETNTESPK